jgi:NIPSNAP
VNAIHFLSCDIIKLHCFKIIIMKNTSTIALLFSIFLFGFTLPQKNIQYNKDKPEYYRITVYHFVDAGQEKILDNYLEKALLPSLHKNKFENIGVFKPIANDTAADKTIYIFINAKTIEDLAATDALLNGDAGYKIAAKEYLDAAYNTAPFTRYETILLKAFPMAMKMNLPNLTSVKSEHIYELRSYESATDALYKNKVHMFNKGGEVTLFKKLEFNAVFYADVISGSRMPNLMYMTSFENMPARDAHWKSFVDAPEWKRLSTLPEYQHNVSKADIILMHAAPYSDF